jgi:hypothetical protein
LKKYGQICKVRVVFLITSLKDLFVLKLFHQKFGVGNEFKKFYAIVDFYKKVIAIVKEDYPSYKSLQKVALSYGFTKEEIEAAQPEQEGAFEQAAFLASSTATNHIREITGKETMESPTIERNGKIINELAPPE